MNPEKPNFNPEPANAESRGKKIELDRIRYEAEDAEDMLSSVLERKNPYSETLKVKPDGKLDSAWRPDGKPVYLKACGDTPEEFYKIAEEIERNHPEYHFTFETDPYGEWMKYTVSKSEK